LRFVRINLIYTQQFTKIQKSGFRYEESKIFRKEDQWPRKQNRAQDEKNKISPYFFKGTGTKILEPIEKESDLRTIQLHIAGLTVIVIGISILPV
jgi:hypothetical protein